MINAIDNKYIEIAVIQEAIIMKPIKIKNKQKKIIIRIHKDYNLENQF